MYSFSKLSTIENCPYEAYLSYTVHQKNKKQGIWGVLGGKLHDKLEDITNNEAPVEDLKGVVDKELEYLDILGLDFPKDFKGGDSIRKNWVTNMQHFCDNFTQLKGKYTTEELVILKVDDDHYIQGYVDLVKHNNDGTVSILDWKTSSLYSAEDFKHAAHQLVIYGLAKEAEGEKIKSLAWIFMKYVTVEFMGKKRSNAVKKTLITKTIERRKIAQELQPYITKDLYDAGYSDIDIQIQIDRLLKTNSLDELPDEIKRNYKIKPCVKTTEFNREAKETTWQYIKETIDDFERREENEKAWEPRDFFKITKTGKEVEDVFYCNALCNYGHTCKHIQQFNESRAEKSIEDDKYAGLFE